MHCSASLHPPGGKRGRRRRRKRWWGRSGKRGMRRWGSMEASLAETAAPKLAQWSRAGMKHGKEERRGEGVEEWRRWEGGW